MNAKQKKLLDDAISTLETLANDIGEIAEAERESFDKKSEKAQQSEKGEAQDALANTLREVADALTEASGNLGGLDLE